MKQYSEVLITDDNEDEESEKLADQNGWAYCQYLGFFENLPSSFSKQENKNGYEEMVDVRTYPNHAIDCSAPIYTTVIAYQFANGYMCFGERDSIYD